MRQNPSRTSNTVLFTSILADSFNAIVAKFSSTALVSTHPLLISISESLKFVLLSVSYCVLEIWKAVRHKV